MSTLNFEELDPEGFQTLRAISKADQFNLWMFRTIERFCQGKVLEIGSGIGNISRIFLDNGYQIALSDIRKNYCGILGKEFQAYDNLNGIVNIDLVDPDFESQAAGLLNQFDSVFALNVVEHIEDDDLAIQNCHKLLKDGGTIIILVPAFQGLYNRFDHELGHFRRYNKRKLTDLLGNNGFEIVHSQYFNLAGILGWFFSGKVLKKKTIPENQMNIYNKLVPIFKIVDQLTANRAGLSVVSVGKKTVSRRNE